MFPFQTPFTRCPYLLGSMTSMKHLQISRITFWAISTSTSVSATTAILRRKHERTCPRSDLQQYELWCYSEGKQMFCNHVVHSMHTRSHVPVRSVIWGGWGPSPPPPRKKKKRKKKEKKRKEKKRRKKERKKWTMNNVKLLHIKCCFFQFFNSLVALKIFKKLTPLQEKVEMTPWFQFCYNNIRTTPNLSNVELG